MHLHKGVLPKEGINTTAIHFTVLFKKGGIFCDVSTVEKHKGILIIYSKISTIQRKSTCFENILRVKETILILGYIN